MKLLSIIFLTTVFCTSSLHAQKIQKYRKDSSYLQNIKDLNIYPDTSISKDTNKLPYARISIRDVRFDTSLIALYAKVNNGFGPRILNYKLDFAGGVENALNNYFNNLFKQQFTNSRNELVCFIKTFYATRRDSIVENGASNKNIAQMHLAADVFLKTDGLYYPAFRVDTLLIETIKTRKKEVTDEVKENLLSPLCDMLTAKMTRINIDYVLNKKAFTDSFLQISYYSNRFNLPILTDTFYRKGIYKNFEEFKNNDPSVTHFKIKKEKFESISLIDEDGNYINTMRIFGFSDGKNCWIQHGNFCYPLIRMGNSFEFFWTIPISILENVKLLMLVNMQSGKVN